MRAALSAKAIAVGPLLTGDGYQFANLNDPSGNAVSLSGRLLAV